MFDRIVVPLDGQSLSETALPYAAELARRYATTLDLVQVETPTVVLPPAPGAVVVAHPGAQGGRPYLEGVAARLKEQEWVGQVAVTCLGGFAPDALIRHVRDNRASMLVMTTHARTGLQRWLLGSVTERLVRHCPCPVLTVNPGSAGRCTHLGDILVPLDGSQLSEGALLYAADLAHRCQARLTLLRVRTAPESATMQWYAQEEREVTAYLSELAEWLQARGCPDVSWLAPHGEKSLPRILEAAEDADLIVLTSHGRGGLERMMMGSVAEEVLRHSRCPTLVINRETLLATHRAVDGDPRVARLVERRDALR